MKIDDRCHYSVLLRMNIFTYLDSMVSRVRDENVILTVAGHVPRVVKLTISVTFFAEDIHKGSSDGKNL